MALADEITRFVAGPAEVAIWALGQSGFIIKGRAGTAVLDPYLSDSIKEFARLFPVPIAPEELVGIDLILATHIHDDHCDRSTSEPLLRANENARILGPYPVRKAVASWGVDRERIAAYPLDKLERFGGIEVMAVPAAHSEFDLSDAGEPAFAGYVLNFDGVSLYHAGDGILYDGQAERLRAMNVDVAMLAVNGRDAVRERLGIIGNTDAREAFWLADAIGSPLVIPMHNDLFALNRAPWSSVWETRDAHFPHLRCHRLIPGEMLLVRPSR